MAEKWPQSRYISANYARSFRDLSAFLRHISADLYGVCECDGRGCTICIAVEALQEAALRFDALDAEEK